MEKEAADGYQNDIKGRNEAGLSGAGGAQAQLLKIGGHCQSRTAAKTAQKQLPPILPPLDRSAVILLGPHKPKNPQAQAQHYRRHQRPGSIKCKGFHIIGSHTLSHKGRAPDKGGQNGKHILPDAICFHLAPTPKPW